MSNKKSPYKTPLKSRQDIEGFLAEHADYYRNFSTCSPLAWNVKAYGVDLSFEHLLEVYRTSGEYSQDEHWLDYPEWRVPAEEEYERVKDDLFDWAIEQARDNVTDSDSYRTLWSGEELDVEYGFTGRSGGWLIMTRFEDADFTRMADYEFCGWLEEVGFSSLRNLYRLVVQNDHDFRREVVEQEVEYQAAFTFIENICGEIPRPDKTQAELPI